MHGSESTAARSCKFIFRAGRRVAPLRGSTSPPAFEISFKILEGEGVGPIGQTRSQKIRDRISNVGGEVEPRKGATRGPARKINLQLRAAVDSEPCMHAMARD